MMWIFIKEFSELRGEEAAANRVAHVRLSLLPDCSII